MIDGKITVEVVSKRKDSLGKFSIIEKNLHLKIENIYSNMLFVKGGQAYCLGSPEDKCFGYFCCYEESETRLKASEALLYYKLLSGCPMCGGVSAQVKITFDEKIIQAPVVGPEISYIEILHECNKCKAKWSNDETDANIELALKESTDKSIPIMLDKINVLYGYPNSHVERVLNLPFGSLEKWRQGDYTPEAAVLLRILYQDATKLLEA